MTGDLDKSRKERMPPPAVPLVVQLRTILQVQFGRKNRPALAESNRRIDASASCSKQRRRPHRSREAGKILMATSQSRRVSRVRYTSPISPTVFGAMISYQLSCVVSPPWLFVGQITHLICLGNQRCLESSDLQPNARLFV